RRFPDARHHIDLLLQKTPDDGALLDLQGQCQWGVGDFQAAAGSLEEAIRNSPDRLDSYARLAVLLQTRLDDAGKASEVLNAMVKKTPTVARAYVTRGAHALASRTTPPGRRKRGASEAGENEAAADSQPAEQRPDSGAAGEEEKEGGAKTAAADD